jgi:hypothetical protein
VNNLAKRAETAITVPTDKNPFEQYGKENSVLIGSLLKFSKGDYLVGKDNELFNDDPKLVAVVPQLLHGWVRWETAKPAEQIMGLLAEGFSPPPRDKLGHDDEAEWECGEDGRARDPWQLTIYLPMVSVDAENVYTFSTSSDGGRRLGVKPLCLAYGKRMRTNPDELPVVQLHQDSYPHKIKAYGRIKHPLFPVEDWVKADAYIAAVAAAAGRQIEPPAGGTTEISVLIHARPRMAGLSLCPSSTDDHASRRAIHRRILRRIFDAPGLPVRAAERARRKAG